MSKSVLTPLDHFSVAALKGTLSLLMINLVSTLMNAQLVHTTASSTVSTPTEGTSVAATQATSSTLMEGTVLVCMYTPMIIAYKVCHANTPIILNFAILIQYIMVS